LFHLIVTDDAGLLHYYAAAREHDEIGYAANVVTRGELRIFFGINFYDYGLADHVGGGPCHFGSSGAARAAPIGPEIYEYGDGRVLNDFIKLRIINRERFRDGRQWRFASSATAGVGEMFGGNAIVLSAMGASANDRHRTKTSVIFKWR
jgi:hypothetical protein